MKEVCVITGGGSGMGLSAAKFIGPDYKIVITGRTHSKLDGACHELKTLGLDVDAVTCDVSDRASVKTLVDQASELGRIKAVIHSAGVSPSMGNAEYIFSINALGTININELFSEIMGEGSCIVDVASNAAYLMPVDNFPRELYPLAISSPTSFCSQVNTQLSVLSEDAAKGFSYGISKDFVIWFAKQCALAYSSRKIRVISVSPGTFETSMGIAEGEQASDLAIAGPLGRMGRSDEIGCLLAFLAIGDATYLNATDILCDGGCVAALTDN
jgi:NAD(P)-dependent dehydrogenase (short-subunit alcohol dehydrogenase family)